MLSHILVSVNLAKTWEHQHVKKSCPHRVRGMSTPEEYFTGKKPDISHLKIFGSSIYIHVIEDARKKMEPIAEVGIFVGYT